MKLFEVNLTRIADLLVVGDSEREVVDALRDTDIDHLDLPEWEMYTTDLIANARTEQACDRLLAGRMPDAVVQNGVLMSFDDAPEVLEVIEEALRNKKAKIYMDEHQLKLPGFE